MRLRRLTLAVLAAFFIGTPATAWANPGQAGVQVALRSLGLYPGAIDGRVGPATVAGVESVQRKAGLPQTGIVDNRTRAALGPLGAPRWGTRVIVQGFFGLDVSVLQFLLGARGDYHGAVDGWFGPKTKAAVIDFQRSAHISADGVVGPTTRKLLVRAAYAARKHRAVHKQLETKVYVVRPGDTLTAIADQAGVTLPKLARLNKVDPGKVLLIGTKLRVPVHVQAVALDAAPSTVRDHLDVWSVKLGVSPHLVRALAWMESGYQPNVVSDVGARGVLQTLPETRDYVETVLIGHPVPHDLDGDIQVGIVYLRHLLQVFGGNETLALAGWYQGERAVRTYGLYQMTKPFVADVLALSTRM